LTAPRTAASLLPPQEHQEGIGHYRFKADVAAHDSPPPIVGFLSKSMLLDLSIILTIVVAILAGTDLLFGDPRKKAISDSSIRVWAALDAAKDRTILLWLRRHLLRRWIFGAGLVLAGLYLLWALLNRQNPYSLLSFGEFAVIIVCVWAGMNIIEFTISAKSLLGAFARVTLLLPIALIPIAALSMFTYSFLIHFRCVAKLHSFKCFG
jgi:hypothetical protein